MKRWVLLLSWWGCALMLPAQNLLDNSSFERHADRVGRVPHGWLNAGPPTESPPDVHTNAGGHFGVQQRAAHGEAYLGMVARDNFTFEAVAQRIKGGLRAGVTYRLTLRVCTSPDMASLSRLTGQHARYNHPIPFDVYLSDKPAADDFVLVARSAPVTHPDWRAYSLEFVPTRDRKYLRVGAGMNTLLARPVCGNVLIDQLVLEVVPAPVE